MTKAFDAKNQVIVRDIAKKLNLEVGMSTSIVVEH
jgi:hypothetical protein